MRRDVADLLRYSFIWLFITVWLAVGVRYTTPPAGPYSDLILKAFEVMVAIVLPAGALVLAAAWFFVLRERRR